ncbi:MAG: hypothetical protein N2746_04140 [Deltaproteobacteria bacterium]|nr:hypothetical protein [Deltaproteobacteria bacterium]
MVKIANLPLFIVFVLVVSSNFCCSSNNVSISDIHFMDISESRDASISDIDLNEDIKVDVLQHDKYFAISFEDNTLKFFDREKSSEQPFFSVNSKGEISSLEYIADEDMIVFSDLGSKEVVFLKKFIEYKRIQNVGNFPYSMRYIPKIKLLIVPDKSSNRLYVFDTEKMELSNISPMTAGGNYPISICYDDKPLTQGLIVRLMILNYGSLTVRAYDIFDKDNWGFRSEQLPTLAEPSDIACDSENRRLLVVNSGSNNISVYGLDDLVQIPNSPFEAGKNPTYAAIYSSASVAYVTNTSDDSLTIFSTVEMKAKGGINFKPQDRPTRVYVNGSEKRLYVLLSGAKSLIIYSIENPMVPEKISQIIFTSTPKELIYR